MPGHHLPGGARLWGAPLWDGCLSAEHNVEVVIPFPACFAKAAGPESLDGLAVRLHDGAGTVGMPALSRYFARLLTCLAARDPRPGSTFTGGVAAPGWQFSFHGTGLLAAVYSPLYQAAHSRHSSQGTFVLLQSGAAHGPRRAGASHAEDHAEGEAGGTRLPSAALARRS